MMMMGSRDKSEVRMRQEFPASDPQRSSLAVFFINIATIGELTEHGITGEEEKRRSEWGDASFKGLTQLLPE